MDPHACGWQKLRKVGKGRNQTLLVATTTPPPKTTSDISLITDLYHCYTIHGNSPPIVFRLYLNKMENRMEIKSGASQLILSKKTCKPVGDTRT